MSGRPHSSHPEEAPRDRKTVVRKYCKIKLAMLTRCSSGVGGEITLNAIPISARLLALKRRGAQIYSKEPFDENQELRVGIGLPNGMTIQSNALVCACKPVPKRGGYASEFMFVDLSKRDVAILAAFLDKLSGSSGD